LQKTYNERGNLLSESMTREKTKERGRENREPTVFTKNSNKIPTNSPTKFQAATTMDSHKPSLDNKVYPQH